MTLLVGMIGHDGIVLAADQSRTLQAESEGTFDDQMLQRKIFHLERHGISYSVAGDELTDEIGYKIRKYLDDGGLEFPNISGCLQRMVEQAVPEIREENAVSQVVVERTILVVFHGSQVPEPQLWRLRISPSISAKQVTGITVAGGKGLDIAFFQNGYRFLGEDEKDQLRKQSQELDALIRAQLLNALPDRGKSSLIPSL
jgi:hypothetical protein